MRVEGDVAYIGSEGNSGKLLALDVSDPADIDVLDQIDNHWTTTLGFNGSILAAPRPGLLRLYDVSESGSLELLGTTPTADVPIDTVDLGDNEAYLGSIFGLQIIDFSSCVGCPADINGDGVLNVLDFVAFQVLWVDQDPAADCDDNGLFNVLDFVCYQELFVAGCD